MGMKHDADGSVLLPRRVIAALDASGGPSKNDFGHLCCDLDWEWVDCDSRPRTHQGTLDGVGEHT
jgi:hypothetical protein